MRELIVVMTNDRLTVLRGICPVCTMGTDPKKPAHTEGDRPQNRTTVHTHRKQRGVKKTTSEDPVNCG